MEVIEEDNVNDDEISQAGPNNDEVIEITEKEVPGGDKPEFDPQHAQLFEPHSFAPKDLLSLLRTIESDMHVTEVS